MKKKHLKSFITEAIKEAINGTYPTKSSSDEYSMSEYNQEVSNRFKNLITNILNYTENLNIHISSEYITISCEDTKNLKKLKNVSSKYTGPINDENFLEINIKKDSGFSISSGYKLRSNYRDVKMYDDLISEITNKLQKKNSNNFEDIYSKVMIESGIIRDSNLDEILD